MKVAFDTNVLMYAEGIDTVEKRDIAIGVIGEIPRDKAVIPLQALGESFHVLIRKGKRTRSEARTTILNWIDTYSTVPTTAEVLAAAADLAAEHRLAIWDAVILAAASQAGCRLLLTEDLQDGFRWGGVTIANPFASPRHLLLEGILARSGPLS
ncbi:PIN domain-containing protein [Methylobacterium komagatae]|uniref:PIN domain-containing protein n=1 Tax=Methylobacterium komagatae TaxID=374425 RepID=A0ABW2BLM8_9HYPH